MFKPLLRTMPSLSGNVKLVCMLNDFTEIGEHIFESNVRIARLNTLSSELDDKYIPVALLNSSYEWDLNNFYKKCYDSFYSSCFAYNKMDLPIYDSSKTNKSRNTDFEFGVKRISYLKSGKQFAFFAPIYLESEKDMPDYFEIKIEMLNNDYFGTRTIRVNINKDISGINYLGKYIYDYAKRIDDNVVYCNQVDNEGLYFGINVEKGGFAMKHDANLKAIFTKQNSILNFDNIISSGFKRNKMVMKQILPLAFYFSINDILTDYERTLFYGSELRVSGHWFKDNKEVPFYDFNINYTFYQPSIPILNDETGAMTWKIPLFNNPIKDTAYHMNIMNVGYPSLHESLFYGYRFSNKINPSFCKWKLKYSDDRHPYVTNMSGAFSFYQNSKTKYGQYPNLYDNVCGMVTKRPAYLNFVLPLNGGDKLYSIKTVNRYKDIRNKYCSEWFETFEDMSTVLSKCKDVRDNKVYFNGILYNLQNIYDSLPLSRKVMPKIDKFGVFVRPVFHYIDDEQIREVNVYSNYTILKEDSKYIDYRKPNCHVNDDVLSESDIRLFSNIKTNVNRDLITMNDIYVKNKEDDGDFINLIDYDVDWYESNDFIRIEDIEDNKGEMVYTDLLEESIDGYELLPQFCMANMLDNKNRIRKEVTTYTPLYISNDGSNLRFPIDDEYIATGEELTYKYSLYNTTFYKKSKFIDRYRAAYTVKTTYEKFVARKYPSLSYFKASEMAYTMTTNFINKNISNLCSYQYNPVVITESGDVYASKVFTSTYSISPRFYGDKIRYRNEKLPVPQSYDIYYMPDINIKQTYTYLLDNDFIYVDPYNLNTVIAHYNNSWLANNEKLAYYINEDAIYDSWYFGKYIASSEYNQISEFRKFDITSEYIVNNPDSEEAKIISFIADKYATICYKVDRHQVYNLVRLVLGRNKAISIKEQNIEFFNSIEEAIENIKTNVIMINGKEYNKQVINAITKILRYDINTDDINSIVCYAQHLISTAGIDENYFNKKESKETPIRLKMMDSLRTTDIFAKFLNKIHLKCFFKRLYSQDPMYTDYCEEDGIKSFDNIYIRKRVIDRNLVFKDEYIPINNLFDIYNTDGTADQQIDEFLKIIDYDNETGLFYFNTLDHDSDYFYKMNTTIPREKKVISELLWWDRDMYNDRVKNNYRIEAILPPPVDKTITLTKYILLSNKSVNVSELATKIKDKEVIYYDGKAVYRQTNTGYYVKLGNATEPKGVDAIVKKYVSDYIKDINPKKFQFELFFKKRMIKVDDDIWRLINLEETYAAPYKDLYLYRLEQPKEYNKKLYIQPKDAFYGYSGQLNKEDANIEGIIEMPIGCLTPMFNLVQLEAKDKTEIYTEYSINNITRSEIKDELKYGDNREHFYRHGCNNAVCMFDLSTFNRDVPIDIHGTKYVYKKNFPHIKDDPEAPEYEYKWFHDTYDAFGKNNVELVNLCDIKQDYVILSTEVRNVNEFLPKQTLMNVKAFEDTYKDDEELLTYASTFITPGSHVVLDKIDPENPETSKHIEKHVSPRNISYVETSFTYVSVPKEFNTYGYLTTYTYYDSCNLYDKHKISTYDFIDPDTQEKTTYGFYMLDSHINNTINSFNVVSYEGERLKYISYLNGHKLSERASVIGYLYKQLIPFIKNNPLRYFMENVGTIMNPTLFNIRLDYHPLAITDTKTKKLSYYDIIFEKGEFGNLSCERYMDSIVPLITEQSIITAYNLKFKDVNKSFKGSYITNEVFYEEPMSIHSNPGIRVYDGENKWTSYNIKTDFEYKYFNSNKVMNLEERFIYTFKDYLTELEVRIAESDIRVYEVFVEHMSKQLSSKLLTEDKLKWAYKKYKVTFDCEPVRLDDLLAEKLFKLSIIFSLY